MTRQPGTNSGAEVLGAVGPMIAGMRRRPRFHSIAIAVATVVGGLGLSHAQAGQDIFVNGTEWTLANEWSTGAVPGTGDNAVINSLSPTSGTYTITSDAFVVQDIGFTLGTNTILTGNTSAGTLTLNGGRGSGVPLIDANSANTLSIANGSGSGTLGLVLGTTGGSGTFQIDNSGGLTVSSNITQTGAAQTLNIAGIGSGVVQLSGANTFTGGLTITGAEADVTADTALGGDGTYNATDSSVTINGGTLGIVSGDSFTMNSSRQIFLGQTTGSAISVKGSGTTLTFNGVIANLSGNTGFLAKQGAGNLVLGGVSTYTGNTFINYGTITLGVAGALPSTVLFVGQASGGNNGKLDLGGFNQTVTGLNSQFDQAVATGGINTVTSSSGTPTLTINVPAATYASFGNAVGTTAVFQADAGMIAGSLILTKTGSGTQYIGNVITTGLTTVNTYSGGTNINAGTLTLNLQASASDLGSGAVSVANGATFNDAPTTTGVKLTVASLSLANGSTIGGSISSGAAGNEITVTGAASATGTIGVNIFGAGGTPTTTTYTLISAGSGTLNSGTYSVGTVYNNTNFTVGAFAKTATMLTVAITAQSALTNEYWVGGYASGVWGESNGTSTSNWSSTSGGGAQALIPGATATANFSGTSTIGTTTLGANLSVLGINITNTTSALTLNADGNILTINGGGITVASNVPSPTFAAPIFLAASQSWASSTNPVLLTGTVLGTGSKTLTINGGTFNFSGVNEFNSPLTITSGTVIISGSGSFEEGSYGGVIANSGTLIFNSSASQTFSGGVSGTGNLTMSGPGTLVLSATDGIQGVTSVNGGVIQLAAAGALGGTGSIQFGGGTVQYTSASATGNDLSTYITSSTSPITLDTNLQNVTMIGVIDNTNTGGLTKKGLGNLSLNANNGFSGPVTVSAGGLYLNGTNVNVSSLSVANNATLGGSGSASATATVAAGGIVAAGNAGASGSLTLSGLTFGGAGTVSVSGISNYSSTAGVIVSGTNALSLGGNAVTLFLGGAAPSGTGTAHLIQYTGTQLSGGVFSQFSYNASTMIGLSPRTLLTLANDYNAGTSTGDVDLNYSVDFPVWNGNVGGGVWDTGTSANVGGTDNWLSNAFSTATNFITGDTPLFNNSATGTTTVAITPAGVTPGNVTFSNSSKTYTLTSTGTVGMAGGASVAINGGGTVNFTNQNTYTGGTTVSNGSTLGISNDNNIGGAAGALSLQTGATLSLSGTVTSSRSVTLGAGSDIITIATGGNNYSNSGTTLINGDLFITGAGNVTFSGPLTISPSSPASPNTASFNIANGSTLTLNSSTATINMANGGAINGTLVLQAASRYNFENGTFGGAGQIQVATTGSALTNSNTANGPGTVNNGIFLNSTGISFTKGNVTGSYVAGTFVTAIGGTSSPNTTLPLVFGGVISGNSDLNIANSAGSGGGGGPISLGSGTPGGPSGYETYTGTTLINNNGLITLLNSNIFPVTTDVIVGTQSGIGTATLNLNGHSQQIGTLSDGSFVTASAHTVTIVNNGGSPATLTVGDSTQPFTGSTVPIDDGTSTVALVKTGSDTLNLAGKNSTFSGGTTVSNGTLLVTKTDVVNALNMVVTSSGTGLGGVSVSSGARLGGTGTIGNGTSNLSLAGPFTAGANGVVAINPGAVISPGVTTLSDFSSAGVGTLTTGDMTLYGGATPTAGGKYYFKTNVATASNNTQASLITAGTQDLVVANGMLNINTSNGPFVINLVDNGSISGNYIVANAELVQVTNSAVNSGNPVTQAALANLTGDFTVEDNGSVNSSDTVSLIADGSGYDIIVTTPEPGSLGLLGVAALGLLRRRSNRRVVGKI